MSEVVKAVVSVGFIALGVLTGGVTFLPGTALSFTVGAGTFVALGLGLASSLIAPAFQKKVDRVAAAQQLQLGEVPRAAILGRAGIDGSLVDAFNYGGEYSTDWEVLVIALADHECDALEGFFVNDSYVAFTGDGMVAGYNDQLQVFFRPGTWDQSVPGILTDNSAGWTADDRGRSVCYVVVAYKADKRDDENPTWPAGRPRFKWVVRGLKCYQARLDSSIGGSGTHRRDDPSTWEWTENLIDARYNWVRGIYAGNRVDEPEMLLIGRGLSAVEAPPENVFARANLCDEVVDGEARYRIGGPVFANETYLDVESSIAAACAGTIVQREGSVEIDPGEARTPTFHFTDDDLIVGSKVTWSDFLGDDDEGFINTVVARFVDPLQRWVQRGAPVKRDVTDVIADGGSRELTLDVDLVSSVTQAGRLAEIARRLGRIWGRGKATLPPQFAGIEEGDWGTWTSDRRFGGATKTFRVEAWQSGQNWHHQLTLREIAASAYGDGPPGTDGAVADQQPAPGALSEPEESSWSVTAGQLSGAGIATPALIIVGANQNPSASFTQFEYLISAAAPSSTASWITGPMVRASTTRVEIPVAANARYYVAVSSIVDGVKGPRRVLGPVDTASATYPDGTPVEDLKPGEAGADVTASNTAAAIAGQGTGATANSLPDLDPVRGAKIDGVADNATRNTGALADRNDIDLTFVTDAGDFAGLSTIGLNDLRITNRTAQHISETSGRRWAGQTGADVTASNTAAAIAGQGTGATANSLPDLDPVRGAKIDGVADNATRNTGALADRNDIDLTFVTDAGDFAGLSTIGLNDLRITNRTAQHISETSGRRWAGQTGADVTSSNIAAGLIGQGIGATANNLGDLDATANNRVVQNEYFQAYSFGLTASDRPNSDRGLFDRDGNRIGVVPGRSYNVYWRPFGSGTWQSENFDVFGTSADRGAFAARLNGLSAGTHVVVITDDEPRDHRLEGGIPSAMYRCGASRSVFGNPEFEFRSCYILIGVAGMGEGSGQEHYAGLIGNDPDAWLRVSFSITRGASASGGNPMGAALQNISRSSGRLIDGQASYLAGLVGPRSTTNLVPSYTVNASDVTVNLPAHNRKIVGSNGPITLSYGSGSANESFSTTWYAYIDDPDFSGDSTPAISLTNNADDLLHAGRYHIASGTTPASNGTGGSSGGGGGGGGGVNDGDVGAGGLIP